MDEIPESGTVSTGGTDFRATYTLVFSIYYVVEGFVQGLSGIYSIYILDAFGSYDISLVMMIYSLGMLPWTLKFVVGFFNDKWGSKRFGRRFPFIFGFGTWGAASCILMAFFIPADEGLVYTYFLFFSLSINLGMSFSDTALDGLILDVTPKDRLGKVQGWTWSMLLAGGGIGLVVVLLVGQFARPRDFFPALFVTVGVALFAVSFLPRLVKEPPLRGDVHVWKEVRRVFSKKKNYSVFLFTFVAAVAPIMVLTVYGYLVLLTMGVVDVETTKLSLASGNSIDLLEWQAVFLAVNGVGVVLGSLMAGRLADRGRKTAIRVSYLLFVPFCLLSNLFVGFWLGLAGYLVFGLADGNRTISSQTIRGDIAQKEFPDLKSTYYALLVSTINLGQSFSSAAGAWIFAELASVFDDFSLLYFSVSLLGAGILLASYFLFTLIPEADYEFDHHLQERDVVFA
ncbi:MAG: MFS transporter [Promethearchaeota archaeon]